MSVQRLIETECAHLETFCARAEVYWWVQPWPDIDETADFLNQWLQITKRRNWLVELLQMRQSETDLVRAYLVQTKDYPIARS
jgi:hypothetical protein